MTTQQPMRRQSQRAAAIPAPALLQQLVERLEAVQDEQREQAKINQQTSISLDRIANRLENVEHWQDDADRRREKQEDRRDGRDDARPLAIRDWVALGVAIAAFVISMLPHIHFGP